MSFKRRTAVAPASEKATDEQIKAFADAADQDADYRMKMDPNAPRTGGRAVNLPFNDYEWELLNRVCEKSARPKKNFIRMAWIEKAKEILGE